ncbi:MAG: hypothetical protein GY820_09730, partial [Gammaproteobacteria bacterium]|nr:hypothetical protein [Gammaproteobacteria bacterium]
SVPQKVPASLPCSVPQKVPASLPCSVPQKVPVSLPYSVPQPFPALLPSSEDERKHEQRCSVSRPKRESARGERVKVPESACSGLPFSPQKHHNQLVNKGCMPLQVQNDPQREIAEHDSMYPLHDQGIPLAGLASEKHTVPLSVRGKQGQSLAQAPQFGQHPPIGKWHYPASRKGQRFRTVSNNSNGPRMKLACKFFA